MAINITNLINAINAKSSTVGAGVDSALDKAVSLAGGVKNALIYSTINDLPAADSSNSGEIVRLGRSINASTQYYVSFRDKWKQIGVTDSDAVTTNQFVPFQGSNFGYASGAGVIIEKFSFSTDGNATDVGDLTASRSKLAGQSSQISGYTSGGNPPPYGVNTIDKFPFASDANATNIGGLTVSRYEIAGQALTELAGYTSGGFTNPPSSNVIDKFPFATDANATDVGDLTVARSGLVGQSSKEFGYSSGGNSNPSPSVPRNNIDKFPFASDGNATDVGDLSASRSGPAGQSSLTHGYTSGGFDSRLELVPAPAIRYNTIDKFPFAADGNATNVGSLTLARGGSAGQSSTVFGYSSGGSPRDAPLTNIIDKVSFASDGSATDVGDLTAARFHLAGQQY